MKKVLGRTFVNLATLQTIIVEVEAIINDQLLTYVSMDITDPESLTLLHGKRIVSLPHPIVDADELSDPNYGTEPDLKRRAKTQAFLIQGFWKRWRMEYLRELHKTTSNNTQNVQVGDVVLVHDDAPRISWQLAVIEEINKGADGLIRAASICTKDGKTNRPIAKLYPIEVHHPTDSDAVSTESEPTDKDDTQLCKGTEQLQFRQT